MVMVAAPIIPQTRIRFIGETRARVTPSIGETVAVMLTHDWGPLITELAKPEVVADFAAWTDRYGDGATAGRTAVAGAFTGLGLRGAGGAGGVIPLRMGTAAARAGVTLSNTAGSPVPAIRLEGKWTGTRGNDFSVQIDTDPSDATRDRLRLKYKGAVVETYLYTRADITSLAAAVTARDTGNVRVAASPTIVSGTGLALTAGTSLAGGTNGNALISADYLAALLALEFQPFSLLAAANLTDGATQAAVLAWVQAQEAANRPVVWVVGGLAGETVDTAITRSTALADPHVVNFGVGTYHDDLLNEDVSTAQLAPRIAGVLAARGQTKALTGAELGGLHIVGTTGASIADAETAIQRGVTVVIRTDSDEADLRIAKGLSTFTSDVDTARPRQIFSEPRFIRIMDIFIRTLKRYGDREIVGGVPVNQDSRDAVTAEGKRLINELLRLGLILTVAQGADADPFFRMPVTVNDTMPFEFGWQFAYTANFLLGEGRVR